MCYHMLSYILVDNNDFDNHIYITVTLIMIIYINAFNMKIYNNSLISIILLKDLFDHPKLFKFRNPVPQRLFFFAVNRRLSASFYDFSRLRIEHNQSWNSGDRIIFRR